VNLIHEIAHWIVARRLDKKRLKLVNYGLGKSVDDRSTKVQDLSRAAFKKGKLKRDEAQEEEEIASVLGIALVASVSKKAALEELADHGWDDPDDRPELLRKTIRLIKAYGFHEPRVVTERGLEKELAWLYKEYDLAFAS
jgi:hypothetical protein